MPAFLDPNRPVYTCDRTDCESCRLRGKLACHFSGRQLLSFFLFCLPVLVTGVLVLARISLPAVIGWAVCFPLYFGLIEIRVMCSHCPHYAEPETNSLKCWANYGSPKLWKYRPGPMSTMEKIVFFFGMIAVFAYPVVFAALTGMDWLLALYLAFLLLGAFMLRRFLCVQCFNFACPLNRVDAATRTLFFQCNPTVREAYRADR